MRYLWSVRIYIVEPRQFLGIVRVCVFELRTRSQGEEVPKNFREAPLLCNPTDLYNPLAQGPLPPELPPPTFPPCYSVAKYILCAAQPNYSCIETRGLSPLLFFHLPLFFPLILVDLLKYYRHDAA
jgi:hypothetical protein